MSKSSQQVAKNDQDSAMLYGRTFYMWVIIGALLIVLGLFLMSGGSMPSNDVWEDEIIYSARRTVIAPLLLIAGLIVEVFAIFKK